MARPAHKSLYIDKAMSKASFAFKLLCSLCVCVCVCMCVRVCVCVSIDQTPLNKNCLVIYNCNYCGKDYIWETARRLETRLQEHLYTNKESLTAVGEHCKKS
ncbi:hypothetical protein CHS0354_006797 [Potamilus streckersoni]|uniref:Uncharacterized protein n=1 Tax=Potamilus streckersoni TaxID=2493646 RepID=A0AAE0S8G1_9BIVA|nr:hypothetical protein CHS0354_006797 [Potamilus streckersoni]